MPTKKSSLLIFAFAVCAAFLLLPNYYNAQGTSKDTEDQVKKQIDQAYDLIKNANNSATNPADLEKQAKEALSGTQNMLEEQLEDMSPRGECEQYAKEKKDFIRTDYKEEYFIEVDTEDRCLLKKVNSIPHYDNYGNYKGWKVTGIFYTEHYFKYIGDEKEICQKVWNSPDTDDPNPLCFPYWEGDLTKMATIPSSGGWSEEADLPEPIIIKKGEPYERDFSFELIQLLDPRDQSGPYTFSYNTMGGFPPMGLTLWPNGVLKGTPVGKDDHFEACVKNVSGRKVCKVLNIKLEKDKSDKPELGIIDSIKSAFAPAKSTEINYQDLIYGEKGQIKSKILDRITILMKDGSTVEMDQYSSLTPNSEFELTTNIGKFKFNYEKFLGPNSFCAFGALLSESCRQVNTPNGTIRIKGTEFAVENDSSGTSIAVIEGTVLVSDAKNKKEIEINEGQFAFLKDGSLLEEPQSFEPDQLNRWWKEEVELSDEEDDKSTLVMLGIIALIFLIIAITKKFWKRKIITEEEKRVDATEHKIRAVFSLIIGAGTMLLMLIFYLNPKSLQQSIVDIIISPVFPIFGLAGLMLGILEAKMSEKILSASMITLNIISVILWIVFIMPRY